MNISIETVNSKNEAKKETLTRVERELRRTLGNVLLSKKEMVWRWGRSLGVGLFIQPAALNTSQEGEHAGEQVQGLG